MIALLVALAGGLGAAVRFHTDAVIARVNPLPMSIGTLAINTVGSLMLGLFSGWVTFHSGAEEWVSIAGTGFCGGFTTFSTASVEGWRLLRAGRPTAAALHAGGGLLAGVSAAFLGLWLMAR
ncbi:MAG: CrcB family protein [Micropruina sp.]|nr:CrcB family protein [Micropruina sp.]